MLNNICSIQIHIHVHVRVHMYERVQTLCKCIIFLKYL